MTADDTSSSGGVPGPAAPGRRPGDEGAEARADAPPPELGVSRRAEDDRTLRTYRRIRELIVRGRLAPGSRLVETELADRLDVSRTPVRSALMRLRQEGYVVPAPEERRSGNVVAPLTREDAEELLEVMGMLEALAARGCAEGEPADREELAGRMERINQALADAARSDPIDRSRIQELDDGFHSSFVHAGAGSRVMTFYDMVRPQKERYLRFYLSGLADHLDESIREHSAIVERIRDGDPEGAEQAVQTTWRNGAKRLGAVIERRGELGSW